MDDRCPDCGKLYSLVGRIHRCVANKAGTVANKPVANRTGRYRDPEKRKAYMRDLMRSRRDLVRARRSLMVPRSSMSLCAGEHIAPDAAGGGA